MIVDGLKDRLDKEPDFGRTALRSKLSPEVGQGVVQGPPRLPAEGAQAAGVAGEAGDVERPGGIGPLADLRVDPRHGAEAGEGVAHRHGPAAGEIIDASPLPLGGEEAVET